MSLTAKEIKKVAKLARIRLEDSEVESYSKEISGILDWIAMLQEVDTKGVPQMFSVSNVQMPSREDKVTDGNIRDDVLKNAPDSRYGCFVVPKVVESE